MKEREYLKELGKKITDSSVRKEIVNEYEAHIEDCKAALMESGMTDCLLYTSDAADEL